MHGGQALTFIVLAFALYVGAVGAYIFGVMLSLPWPVAMLINYKTAAHLTGQLLFMSVIVLTLFKLSDSFAIGAFTGWNFLFAKFYLGPKRPRGLRNPAVARLQRRMDSSVIEGRSYKGIFFIFRIATVIVFCALTFFKTESRAGASSIPHALPVFAIILGVFSILAAIRLGEGKLDKFFGSPEGRRVAVMSALILSMTLGIARTLTSLQGPTVYFSSEGNVCRLAPMMPVYGGDLYFDRETYNFVVVSSGRITFFIPHPISKEVPACL